MSLSAMVEIKAEVAPDSLPFLISSLAALTLWMKSKQGSL
jgi:hypothetical protein